MRRSRLLARLSLVILIPIALGASYAVATSGDSGPANVAIAEAATAAAVMAASLQAVATAHRIARAKCSQRVGVDRGNCRTEARAEAKRALRIARGAGLPA